MSFKTRLNAVSTEMFLRKNLSIALSSSDSAGVIARRTLDLMGGKKIATTKTTVILENRGAGRVLNGLVGPMSAGNIQQKRSFLTEKKGMQIGSRFLTVIDDPFRLERLDLERMSMIKKETISMDNSIRRVKEWGCNNGKN